jgi:hypothetical protein
MRSLLLLGLPALLPACAQVEDTAAAVDVPRGDCNPVDDSACMFPFPSSFYLKEDATTGSGYRVDFGPTSLPADRFGLQMRPDAWNRRDGYSTLAPLYALLAGADVHSPGSLSFANLADYANADVTTVLLDAATGERVPHYIEREAFPEDPSRAALVIHPAVPLQHATRYVVGIRNLLGDDGAPVSAPKGFATLRDEGATDDPDLERQRTNYDDVIFPALDTAGFDRAELQLAWDFVTVSAESSRATVLGVRDAGLAAVPEDGPPYTITETIENTCGGGEKVGRHITGEMTVPLYLTDAAPSSMLNRDDPTGPDSAVSQNGTAQVPFTIIVPCSVLTAGVPAPLLQVGHGLFGSHTDIRWDPYTPVAEAAGMVMFATSWRGMSSDDYNAVTLMMAQDPSDFDIIPDGLTQGHLEALLMARLMQGAMVGDAALSVNDEPLIDPTQVHYYGVSLGSVLGGAQVAMSPDIDRAVMQISGMSFSTILTRSSAFSAFLLLLGAKYDDPADISLIVPLAQMLWDPVESAGWADQLVDGASVGGRDDRRFLFQVGIGDDTVSSIGGAVYARTAGASLIGPAPRDIFGVPALTDPNSGSGILEWDYGCAETDAPLPAGLGEANPHNRLPGEDSAQAQAAAFLSDGDLSSPCDGVCDPS